MPDRTDRELLELAARAAGVKIVPCTCSYEEWPFKYADGQGRRGHWNPLVNDGDALRLAVSLQFDININDDECDVFCSETFINERGNDIARTVRRAIVRAAAEIGANMQS